MSERLDGMDVGICESLAAQARHPVFVAFLDRGLVGDALAQVAAGQGFDRIAARRAQRVDVAQARAQFVAGTGVAVAEFFPRRCARALGQRAVQVAFGLRPLPLQLGQPRQGQR